MTQQKNPQWFEFVIHRKDNTNRGVCFSPQKYNIIKSVENQDKVGVKVRRAIFSNDEYKVNSRRIVVVEFQKSGTKI